MSNGQPAAKRSGDLDIDMISCVRVTPAQSRRATLVIAQRFFDQPAIARELLEMLGLFHGTASR